MPGDPVTNSRLLTPGKSGNRTSGFSPDSTPPIRALDAKVNSRVEIVFKQIRWDCSYASRLRPRFRKETKSDIARDVFCG
jgi:hypothetical protein